MKVTRSLKWLNILVLLVILAAGSLVIKLNPDSLDMATAANPSFRDEFTALDPAIWGSSVWDHRDASVGINAGTLQIQSQAPYNATIGTSTTAYLRGNQRRTFYTQGRHWVFYSDGTNMVFRTSTDGNTWSAATTVRAATANQMFGLWFDGTYVHYAYSSWVSNTPLYYRRGTPVAAGTVTWTAEVEAVAAVANYRHYYADVSVSSGGFPWVTYRTQDMTDSDPNTPFCSKSSTTDGTFVADAGFPYQLTATLDLWYVASIPLTNNRMVVLYSRGVATGEQVRTQRWDGVAWSGIERQTTTKVDQAEFWNFNGVSQSDDIDMCIGEEGGDIHYERYTYATDTWATTKQIDTATADSTPVLSKGATGNLYVVWSDSTDADKIKVWRRVGTTWDAYPYVIERDTTITNHTSMSISAQETSGYINLIWWQGPGAVYNVQHYYLYFGSTDDAALAYLKEPVIQGDRGCYVAGYTTATATPTTYDTTQEVGVVDLMSITYSATTPTYFMSQDSANYMRMGVRLYDWSAISGFADFRLLIYYVTPAGTWMTFDTTTHAWEAATNYIDTLAELDEYNIYFEVDASSQWRFMVTDSADARWVAITDFVGFNALKFPNDNLFVTFGDFFQNYYWVTLKLDWFEYCDDRESLAVSNGRWDGIVDLMVYRINIYNESFDTFGIPWTDPLIEAADFPGAAAVTECGGTYAVEWNGKIYLFVNGHTAGGHSQIWYFTTTDEGDTLVRPQDTAIITNASGGWDDTSTYWATVVRDSNEPAASKWHMFYAGDTGHTYVHHIGEASAADPPVAGAWVWTKNAANPIIHDGAGGTWNAEGSLPYDLVISGGNRYLYGTGWAAVGPPSDWNGGMWTNDGSDWVTWAEYTSNPTLDRNATKTEALTVNLAEGASLLTVASSADFVDGDVVVLYDQEIHAGTGEWDVNRVQDIPDATHILLERGASRPYTVADTATLRGIDYQSRCHAFTTVYPARWGIATPFVQFGTFVPQPCTELNEYITGLNDTNWTTVMARTPVIPMSPINYGMYCSMENVRLVKELIQPEVTTAAASDITCTTAILHGVLDDDCDVATQVFFQYGLDATYGTTTVAQLGYTDGEAFQAKRTGLALGTTYHFRAVAYNAAYGYGYGADATFTTSSEIATATNFFALPNPDGTVSLSWVMGDGASESIVRYKLGSTPLTYTDGSSAYTGEEQSYNLEGLSIGYTYFFAVWGYCDPAIYSDNAAEAIATTYAMIVPSEFDDFPADMYGTTTTAWYTSFPGHEVLEWLSDAMQMSDIYVVRLIYIIIAMLAVVGIAIVSKSSMVTVFGALIIGAIGVVLGNLIPLWMLLTYGFVGLGISYIKRGQGYA